MKTFYSKQMDQATHLKDLKFISNDYIIYINGNDISGHCYGYLREIRIRKSRKEGEVYCVTIYKLDAHSAIRGKLMPATQMMLVEQDNLRIQLKNSDYGLMLGLHNNSVEAITLRRYDTCRDTVFIKAPSKELEKAINIPLAVHLTGLNTLGKNGLVERYQGIVKEMEEKGSAIESMASYYLFLGKLHFSQGTYREATEAFTQCLMMLIFNGLQPNHEAIYRFAMVKEAEGNISEAKMFYHLALERYTYNAGLVSRGEIIEALNK